MKITLLNIVISPRKQNGRPVPSHRRSGQISKFKVHHDILKLAEMESNTKEHVVRQADMDVERRRRLTRVQVHKTTSIIMLQIE